MKIAKVTPVFKTGDKTLFTNYRPISVLPTFSKLLERLMYNRIYNYLQNESLFYDKQYGFRSGISTKHALLELVDKITDSLDNKKYTLGVFISKGFDTIDHKILIEKLPYYGIEGRNRDWLENYHGKKALNFP